MKKKKIEIDPRATRIMYAVPPGTISKEEKERRREYVRKLQLARRLQAWLDSRGNPPIDQEED